MAPRPFPTASLLALAAALSLPALAMAAEPGKPPLSSITAESGLPMPAEQKAVTLERVDLAIEVLPETEQIAGDATLDFTATARTRKLIIDLDRNLPVSAVSVNGVALKPGKWSNPEGRLGIQLPKAARKGDRLSVRIVYGGTPHVAVRSPWDGGFTWAKTESGKPWVATAVQGEGCDLFWPCIDHPTGEPRTMALHITVPAGLSAPSNGVLKRVETLADGRSTWHWEIKNPNTYGIALNVGPYKEIKGEYKSRYGNTIPMHYWHLEGRDKQAAGLFAEFAPTLDFFETLVGPYPFGDEKVGVVETPHLGMEHQTINAYGNEYRKAPTGFDWLFHHEFAHEWFANQLTARDWDDFWLHEGYGAYMQPLYGRWREGEARYATMMDGSRNTIRNKFPIISGETRAEGAVYDPETGPGGDIYVKGAWMLHTLRNLIGDKAFFDATRRLVYGRPDPEPGNFKPRYSSSAEFQRIVNEVTGKDYGWFFDVYLREAALPELVAREANGRLSLEWEAPKDKPFPMPVEVQIGDRIEKLAMAGGRGSVAVPDGAHVVVDPHARILKRSANVEAFQAWQAAEAKKKEAAEKAKKATE